MGISCHFSFKKVLKETGQKKANIHLYNTSLKIQRKLLWMYEHRHNKIDDRIVSICQPHVRPIKRGKAGASTEFGAKLSASLVDGYCFLDCLSWDNFNECGDLKQQVKAYLCRFGFFPESVHADSIYRTQKNIKFCKKHGIRLSGPALGRPPKHIETQRELKKQARQDELDRNHIFATAGYRLLDPMNHNDGFDFSVMQVSCSKKTVYLFKIARHPYVRP
jgi:hypothetical protein